MGPSGHTAGGPPEGLWPADDIVGDNKENRTPTINQKPPSHALTLPRLGPRQVRTARGPAVQEISPVADRTPCMVPTVMAGLSNSAPVARPLGNVTNVLDPAPRAKRPPQPVQDDLGAILEGLCQSQQARRETPGPRPAAAGPAGQAWPYASTREGCLALVRKLRLVLDPDALASFERPLDLFRFLEGSGQLSASVLAAFRRCPGIDTLDLTVSYASRLNGAGLLQEGPYAARRCTVPVFKGYQHLLVIDLTNVLVGDDELRFLIHLERLQALGLSGTKVTSRGLKYLSKHARFKCSLRCIKLCYNVLIDDAGLGFLAAFRGLSEADLLGCPKLTLRGALALTQQWPHLSKVRLPHSLDRRLEDLHHRYAALARQHPHMVLEPRECPDLTDDQLRAQLKLHQPAFPDVFLNVPRSELLARLSGILGERQAQERLYGLKP